MYNYLMLIGQVKEIDEANKQFKIAVKRPFKNAKDEIEQDIFTLETCDFVFDIFKDMMCLGEIVSVKGRLQAEKDKNVLIAEKIMVMGHNPKQL